MSGTTKKSQTHKVVPGTTPEPREPRIKQREPRFPPTINGQYGNHHHPIGVVVPKTRKPRHQTNPKTHHVLTSTTVKSGRYKETNPVYRGQWRTIRRTILQRDNHTCQIGLPGCQTTATCVDHIQPVSLGGEWYAEENLRASCGQCNAELAKIAARVKRQQTPGNPNVNINGITTVASRRW